MKKIVLGALLVSFSFANTYPVTVKADPDQPKVINIFVRDTDRQKRELKLATENIFIDHVNPAEFHNTSLYVLKKIPTKRTKYKTELWKFTDTTNTLVYTGPFLDFRVRPDEAFCTIRKDPYVVFLNAQGEKIKVYAAQDFWNSDEAYFKLLGWDNGVMWVGIKSGQYWKKIIAIHPEAWTYYTYPINGLYADQEFSFNTHTRKFIYSHYDKKKKYNSLLWYSLADNKGEQIVTTSVYSYNPAWANDDAVEFDAPAGDGRIRFSVH